MRFLLLVNMIVLGSGICRALRCQNCHNAKSDEECEAIGYIETCQQNQEACKTEIRIHDGHEHPLITKRCKQDLACTNNEIQNNAADGISSQCNQDNTVCRCCCRTDLCNVKPFCGRKEGEKEKEGRNDESSKCRELAIPENGAKVCSGSTNVVGTLCDFSCNNGYELIGQIKIVCTQIAIGVTWSSQTPVCEKRCTTIKSIDNGSVLCDGNAVGDKCLLFCKTGFRGPPQVTCDWPEWSITNIQCLPIRCKNLNTPENGEKRCTDGNKLTSVCEFTCNVGFWLDGSDSSECENGDPWPEVYGKWSSDPSVCRVVTCVVQQVPENGKKNCSNGNKWNSVCDFSCNSGYGLEGKAKSTCQDDDNVNNNKYGNWDSNPPTCKKLECKKLGDIANGKVECSSENPAVMKCIHSCNKGYKLQGRKELKCLGGQGQYDGWDYPQPACIKIRCNPIGSINDGQVNCSDSNFHGSICKFTCRVGCWRKGEESSVCGEITVGSWSNMKPTCEAINCVPQKIIKNGNKQCTNGTRWNSECRFFCDEGYWLNGTQVSTCLHVGNQPTGKWSSERPICKAKKCNDQLANPKHGTISCSKGRIHGSVCRFSCRDGFKLVGKDSTICKLPTGDTKFSDWSEPVPACRQIKCRKHIEQENGDIKCSNDNYYMSICTHTCNEGYKLSSYDVTECLGKAGKYGGWSHPQPMCKRVCRDVENLPHGMVKCSNRNFEGSECQLNCTEVGYELYPTGKDTRSCMNDGTWSNEDLCCAWKCPPNAYMDMVIILDSSSSIGKENWKIMKEFISEFVEQFTWGNLYSRFALFRYNRIVYDAIMWNNNTDATGFHSKLSSMPYDGSGTNTRDALKYGLELITKYSRQDAVKVMLLVTDGISQTNVDSIARRLRNQDDLSVFVLPVLPERFQKMPDGEKKENFVKDMITQMEVISGSRKNVMEEAYKATEEGFDALMEDKLIKKIAKFVCGNPCHHTSHNH